MEHGFARRTIGCTVLIGAQPEPTPAIEADTLNGIVGQTLPAFALILINNRAVVGGIEAQQAVMIGRNPQISPCIGLQSLRNNARDGKPIALRLQESIGRFEPPMGRCAPHFGVSRIGNPQVPAAVHVD